MKYDLWNRKMWGVTMKSPLSPLSLLGRAWIRGEKPNYEGEPSRTLVFQTRRQAREYCRAENTWCKARTDCCHEWKFRAVRVRETVRMI
jgi:hypothetical protein